VVVRNVTFQGVTVALDLRNLDEDKGGQRM